MYRLKKEKNIYIWVLLIKRFKMTWFTLRNYFKLIRVRLRKKWIEMILEKIILISGNISKDG